VAEASSVADNNLLSTPENYATPGQLEAMRAYSKALLTDSQKPIKHWTQGLSNIVSALVGGNQSFLANKQQNEADAVRGGRMMPDTSGNPVQSEPPMAPTKTSSFSPSPTPEGTKNAGGPIDVERAQKATASIESGGKYDKLGPIINKGSYAGDRAYGKYQVMGKNIPEWTQATFGKAMTPDEFLANPKAQDALYQAKMTEYAAKHGPEGAARAWFAGEGGMNDMGRKDQLGTTVESYGKRFAQAYGPDASQPPAVAAMSAALRGGEGVAPTQVAEAQIAKGGPPPLTGAPRSQRPDPEAGQIYINPALVPKRPQMNPGQVRGILADPTISEAAKLQLRQEYMQQNQPIEVPVTGGRVLINPLNPTQQQFIPELKWGKSKIGDIETDSGYTTDGRGNIIQAPVQRPGVNGPRSEVIPGGPIAPAVAPQGGPTAPASPASAVASAAPAAPVAAPEAVPNTGGVQVASLDPAAGAAAAAKAAEAAPDNPLAKWAQATPPGVAMPAGTAANGSLNLNSVDPVLAEDYARKKAFDTKAEVDKDAQVKGTEMAMKKYDNMSTQAQSARKLMPNLELASTLMEDPNFSAGLLHGVKDTWQRLKDATGIATMSNAPNEAFDKLMAGTVLDTMKSTLAGLGQVRLAEIDLLNKANGNRNNSVASNRAVLEISKRAVQKVDQLDSIAQQYVSGDEVLNPITGTVMLKANIDRNGEMSPRRGLDAGFDKLARKFTLDHPSFKPEEIKNYNTLFTAPAEKAAAPAVAPTEAGAPAVGTKKMFDTPDGKKVEGQWDGKAWGPVK
jgi:hypothetical protein